MLGFGVYFNVVVQRFEEITLLISWASGELMWAFSGLLVLRASKPETLNPHETKL